MANMSICKFIQPQFKVHQKRFSKEPKRIFIPFELLLSHSMVNISTVKFPHSICLSTLKIFIFQITFCFFFIFKLHNKKREKFSNSHTHSLTLPKVFTSPTSRLVTRTRTVVFGRRGKINGRIIRNNLFVLAILTPSTLRVGGGRLLAVSKSGSQRLNLN